MRIRIKKNIPFLILNFLLLYSTVFSQNIKIRGSVFSVLKGISNEIIVPISGTKVTLIDSTETYSDFNGNFVIIISEEDIVKSKYLVFYHRLYNTEVIPIDSVLRHFNKLEIKLTERNSSKLQESLYLGSTISIKGKVKNNSSLPLENIEVSLSKYYPITSTKSNGEFSLKMNRKFIENDSINFLYFTGEGYFDKILPLDLLNDKSVFNIDVKLTEKPLVPLTDSIKIVSFFDIMNTKNNFLVNNYKLLKDSLKLLSDSIVSKQNLLYKLNYDLKNEIKNKIDINQAKNVISKSIEDSFKIFRENVSDSLLHFVKKYNLDNLEYNKNKIASIFTDLMIFRPDSSKGLLSESKTPLLLGMGYWIGKNKRSFISVNVKFNANDGKNGGIFILPMYHYTFPTNIRRIYWQLGLGITSFNKNSYLALDFPLTYDVLELFDNKLLISMGLKYTKIIQSKKDQFFVPLNNYDYAGINICVTLKK
jgi:hypothetical protein